jgi:DNA helicase TIP49 (TBP-interacting protein)
MNLSLTKRKKTVIEKKVTANEIIYLEVNDGSVKKVVRSELYGTEVCWIESPLFEIYIVLLKKWP